MLEILKIRNRGGQSGWSLLGRREKRGREIGVDGVNAVEIFASAIDSSFTFLELSGIFCSQIFLIHGWLNLQMQNLWIQRVNRGYRYIYSFYTYKASVHGVVKRQT